MATYLTGLILALIALLSQEGTERVGLMSSAIGLLAFLIWQQSGHRRLALLSAVFGVLCGLVAAGQHIHTINTSTTVPNKDNLLLEAVVADRDDYPDSVRLRLTQPSAPKEGWQSRDAIQVSFSTTAVTALPGDRVRWQGRLHASTNTHIPGVINYGAWMRENGVVALGSATTPPDVIGHTDDWFWNRLRQSIAQQIADRLPPMQVGLAQAMVVGKRGMIPPELNTALQASGTYHLIAISGFHIALVAGWSFFLLRFALVLIIPLSQRLDVRQLAALLTIVPTLAYAALAGWGAPTERAAIMATLFLLAMAARRTQYGPRALGLSAIVILLHHPDQLFNAGFQLSFVAVAVLLALFSPPLGLPEAWNEIAPAKATQFTLLEHRYLHGLSALNEQTRALVLATLLVGLILTPVTAHHFHRLSPYSLLANLFAIPLTSLISIPAGLVFMVSIFSAAPAIFTTPLLEGVGWSLELLRWIAATTSNLPWSEERIAGPTLIGIGLYLSLLALAWSAKTRASQGMALIAACAALFYPHPQPAPGTLQVATLDVGQGQAVVIRTPDNLWSVLDAGVIGTLSPRFDPGETLVSPYLWYHGVNRLERVIVSHPQQDHLAGAAQLLRNFPTRHLLLGNFPWEESNNHLYRDLLQEAARRKVAVQRGGPGTSWREAGAQFSVLWPPNDGEPLSVNDRALALELTYGIQRFFFPSDMEAAAERRFLARFRGAPYTVALAPHHGSGGSSTAPFIKAIAAKQLIFSVGRDNSFGFPNPHTITRWQNAGATLWRTDQHGTVIVESNGLQLCIRATAPDSPPPLCANGADLSFTPR